MLVIAVVFSAQFAAWGLEPRGYHLVSVLWHAANAILVFRIVLPPSSV